MKSSRRSSRRRNPSAEDEARRRLRKKLERLRLEREKRRAEAARKAARKRAVKRSKEYREASYAKKLRDVRRYVKYSPKKLATARSERRRKEAASIRRKVSRMHKKLEPFLKQSHKDVFPRTDRSLEALREYAGVPDIKGLKAVPVPTPVPEVTEIKVDRRGRVEKTEIIGRHKFSEKIFLFPREPRDPDDLEEMAKRLVRRLPSGFYLVITDTHELLPSLRARELLVDEIRRLSYPYRIGDPAEGTSEGDARFHGFVQRIRGFKWIATSAAAARDYLKTAAGAREVARADYVNPWQALNQRAARAVRRRRSLRERMKGRR